MGMIQEGDGDPRHGTVNGYSNLKCRCEACRFQWRGFVAAARTRRRSTGLAPDDKRHGASTTYSNYGCRCDPCRLAHNAERRRNLAAQRALIKQRLA